MVKANQKIRQIFLSLGSVVMALAVLVQFSFVSVSTMSCLSSGNQVVSVGELDDCCAISPITDESIQAKCCKYESSDKNFHSIHKLGNDHLDQLQIAALNEDFSYVQAFHQEEELEFSTYANPPPKLSGRQLLIHISKFTI